MNLYLIDFTPSFPSDYDFIYVYKSDTFPTNDEVELILKHILYCGAIYIDEITKIDYIDSNCKVRFIN